MNRVLWVMQALLAGLFLFAGGLKLVMPIETMTAQMPVPLPGQLLQFVGVCEVLGGLGLILPGIFATWPVLTAVAAAGLVVIMVGATTITVIGGMTLTALFPFTVGVLLIFVSYARWRVVPHRSRSKRLRM